MTNMKEFEAQILKQWNIKPGTALYKAEVGARKQLDKMEERGVQIDLEKLNSLVAEDDLQLEILRSNILDQTNGMVKAANSSAQVALFLQSEGIEVPRTPKGNPSINQETLAIIQHPAVENILKYRKLLSSTSQMKSVLKSTKGSRVYPKYDGLTCATGRMYTSNPNFQGWGEQARSVILPDEGFSLLSGDYCAQEMRILAALTNCQTLIDLLNSGADLHKSTYSMMYHIPVEEVTPEQRAIAKALNFGTIYGQTVEGLARKQNQSLEWAQAAQDAWFSAYPEVRKWIQDQIRTSRLTRTTKTPLGRERRLNYNADPDKADRQAVNHPIQGSGADVMKKTLSLMSDYESEDFQVLATIHDSLLVQYRNMTSAEAESILRKVMERSFLGKIVLTIDIK